MTDHKNIKNILKYAIAKKSGYLSELHDIDKTGGKYVESMLAVGFIHSGHTMKSRTFKILPLGESYYKDFFGVVPYIIAKAQQITR